MCFPAGRSIAYANGDAGNFKDEFVAGETAVPPYHSTLFGGLADGLYNVFNMDYSVRFLQLDSNGKHCGHLYVGQNRLSLVADYGSPWLKDEPGKVRLARPSGEFIASLEFPGLKTTSKGGNPRTNYALVYDHAVYAIITEYPWPQPNEPDAAPYFEIETEGQRWVALNRPADGRSPTACYVLCADAPANFQPYTQPLDNCLSDPVGQIDRQEAASEFVVMLPDGRFRQAQLILLSLVFLIHQLPA
mgnify:CR=1 FL=1